MQYDSGLQIPNSGGLKYYDSYLISAWKPNHLGSRLLESRTSGDRITSRMIGVTDIPIIQPIEIPHMTSATIFFLVFIFIFYLMVSLSISNPLSSDF
ncbi:MAG: hypothetical protein ACK4NY_03055 [Spirosomataceae bacterium]